MTITIYFIVFLSENFRTEIIRKHYKDELSPDERKSVAAANLSSLHWTHGMDYSEIFCTCDKRNYKTYRDSLKELDVNNATFNSGADEHKPRGETEIYVGGRNNLQILAQAGVQFLGSGLYVSQNKSKSWTQSV